MEKTIDLFLKLVKISSPSGEEKEIGEYIKLWLKKRGFTYKQDKIGNIYATNHSDHKPILFCVHLDTVNPSKGICPIVEKGLIKSSSNTILGADNKAAVASLLTALDLYLKSQKKHRPIELLFAVKEETGGGIEHFPFQWVKAKKGILFDFARPLGGIALRSPFIVNFHAQLMGKPAHSSTPEKGKSVLTTTLEILNQIPTGKINNNIMINVGQIKGGTAVNAILSEIAIEGEARSYNRIVFDQYLKKIQQLFYSISKKNKIKLNFKTESYCSGYSHLRSDSTINKIFKIYTSLGIKPKFYHSSSVSDANVLMQKGIKAYNLCDGVIDPHTTKERVAVNSLISLSQIIYLLLKKL